MEVPLGEGTGALRVGPAREHMGCGVMRVERINELCLAPIAVACGVGGNASVVGGGKRGEQKDVVSDGCV